VRGIDRVIPPRPSMLPGRLPLTARATMQEIGPGLRAFPRWVSHCVAALRNPFLGVMVQSAARCWSNTLRRALSVNSPILRYPVSTMVPDIARTPYFSWGVFPGHGGRRAPSRHPRYEAEWCPDVLRACAVCPLSAVLFCRVKKAQRSQIAVDRPSR